MIRLPGNSDTIAAIATPYGTGGVGLIKISGADALQIATLLFKPKHAKAFRANGVLHSKTEFQCHHLYYGYLIDPAENTICDEVLISYMQAPHSYTCENVVEINSHSGAAVLNYILKLVLKNGARLAEPGEFTRRAFLNGRIDLTQAESVIDLINAQNEKALAIANENLGGGLRHKIEAVKKELLAVLSLIEAIIDFTDDINDSETIEQQAATGIEKIITDIQSLIRLYDDANYLREGFKISIIGKPNVGKSSLMNCLVEKDRSIVTDIPGTTRDLVSETVILNGIPILLSDTAGIQDSQDEVEKLGISKSRESLKNADLVLLVTDTGNLLSQDDFDIYDEVKEKNIVLVHNKIDIMEACFKKRFPDDWKTPPSIYISAKNKQGINALRQVIVKKLHDQPSASSNSLYVPNLRQKLALEKGVAPLFTALDELMAEAPYEIVALNLQETLACLDEITGQTTSQDVLDMIFRNFCIGK